MVKKAVCVIIIAIILFGLAITELVLVESFIIDLDNQIDNLIIEYEENKNNIIKVVPSIEKIKTKWDNAENLLCLMFNHKDTSCLTDSITRLLAYTKNDNYEEGFVELSVLKEYSEKNTSIMGCNLDNIF